MRFFSACIVLFSCLLAGCAWFSPAARAGGAVAGPGQPAPLAADLVSDGQLIELTSPRYQELFAELRDRHGFSQEELDRIFSGVSIKKRVLELMDTQWEARPYFEYYPKFITPKIIERGKKLLAEHRELLERVEKEFGVEKEIVVAIWGVETRFGDNRGSFSLFQTLNTMFDAYPRRSKFYREQLMEFLLLCRENGVEPLTVNGSYGGAFGQTQFIPSSFRLYAVDFDGDGRRDVQESVPDVLASIANYLKRFGWTLKAPVYRELGDKLKGEKLEKAYAQGRRGFVSPAEVKKIQGVTLPPSPDNRELTIVGLELKDGGMRYVAGYPNFQAVTKWNNSNRYAMVIAELAEKLKE